MHCKPVVQCSRELHRFLTFSRETSPYCVSKSLVIALPAASFPIVIWKISSHPDWAARSPMACKTARKRCFLCCEGIRETTCSRGIEVLPCPCAIVDWVSLTDQSWDKCKQWWLLISHCQLLLVILYPAVQRGSM